MTNATYSVSPYKGIPITVSDDGTFRATIDDGEVQRASRREIVDAIDAAEKRAAADKRKEVGLALRVIVDGKVKDATFVGARGRGTSAYGAGSYVVRVDGKMVGLSLTPSSLIGRPGVRAVKPSASEEQIAELLEARRALTEARKRLEKADTDTLLDCSSLPYTSSSSSVESLIAAERAFTTLVIDGEVSK